MNYYRELAFELRVRDYAESDISRIVAQAQAVVVADGRSPREALGNVLDYVDTFGSRSAPTRDKRDLNVAYILVTLVGVGYLLLRLVVPAIDGGFRVGIWGLLGGLVIVTVVGFLQAWRLPDRHP